MDLTLQQLVLRLIAYVFIAAVHGLAVAAVAVAMGDAGPRHDGGLRINPLAHLDVIGTASGVLFSFGWIRPIAIDPAYLRLGRVGLVIVVAAGAPPALFRAFAPRAGGPVLFPVPPPTASRAPVCLVPRAGGVSVGGGGV